MGGPSARKKSSPTVADVAAVAGVSKATAARALGGYGLVSEKVRGAVFAAAERLDYRPNELARSMTTGRSGTIGVVVGDIENPFFSLAMRGITDVGRAAGFTVVVANSSEQIDAEREAVGALLAKRVDGLIVTPSRSQDIEHLREALRAGCPMVLLDRAVPELAVDAVTADDREAAAAATRLLIQNGHRRISYITACDLPANTLFDSTNIYTASVRERVDGFLAVCRRNGIDRREGSVIPGAKGPDETRALAIGLLTSPDAPSAILASDSQIALDLVKVARELGISIPDDLSLITFHDADWTSVTSPPVTVIDQPVYQLGKTAAELLVRRLEGDEHAPSRIVIPSRLVERESVAMPGKAVGAPVAAAFL